MKIQFDIIQSDNSKIENISTWNHATFVPQIGARVRVGNFGPLKVIEVLFLYQDFIVVTVRGGETE